MVDAGNRTESISFPQEPLWKETLEVIKGAEDVGFLSDAKSLALKLPFNSKETRERYGQAMATRFSRLDPSIRQGLVDLARSNVEISIIEQIWRVLFCMAEPLVAQVFLEMIWPREPGTFINRTEIRSYIETAFQQQSAKLHQRIVSCLRQPGYLMPQGKQDLIVVSFGNPEYALMLSTHLLMAHSPRTIRLSEIEESNHWRFLGFRKFDHVRLGFRSAEAKGLIMRYANVDHLEQITTRYTWQELLSKGNKL
ncbi:MAG: hypothetical protein H8D55_02310 [Deltaproteobacteria bacterium]|nr:hypothetical protein [Deltaproteobacteria bacterium]